MQADSREVVCGHSRPACCTGCTQSERILVAVKLNEKGGALVTWALTGAARSGDWLSIIHVKQPPPSSVVDASVEGQMEDMVKTLSTLVTYCRTHYPVPELAIDVHVVENESVGDAVVAEARRMQATMTIVGKSGAHRLQILPKHMSDLGRLCVRKLSPYCHVVVVREGKVLKRRPGTARSRQSLETLLHKQRQSEEETDKDKLIVHSDRSPRSDVYFEPLGADESDDFDPHKFRRPPSDNQASLRSVSEPLWWKTSGLNSSLCSGGSSSSGSEKSPSSVLDRFLQLSHEKSLNDRNSRWPHLEEFVPDVPVTCLPECFCFTQDPKLAKSSSRCSRRSSLEEPAPELVGETTSSSSNSSSSLDSEELATLSPPRFARSCSEVKYTLNEEGLLALQKDVEEELPGIRRFSYDELRQATNDFAPANVVGKGAASSVYKGQLADGRWVAVKRLGVSNVGGTQERDFMMEIMMLVCTLHHPNLVTFVGFCAEGGTGTPRLLVYEFLPRGNVEQNVHGMKKSLSWAQRQKAALGASRGLAYLHSFRPRPIIHRDIKTSNILLSNNFDAQIADFGLARWLSAADDGCTGQDHEVVEEQLSCAGTFGYMAPECFMYANFDERTDVYAFGVVLLELVSGRRPIDQSLSMNEKSLVQWARKLRREGNMHLLVDPRLRDIDPYQYKRMLYTAFLCIEEHPELRPSMHRVVRLLDPECTHSPALLGSTQTNTEQS